MRFILVYRNHFCNLGQESLVGIYSKNCEEYDVSQLAISSNSQVIVPLYDTLGLEAISFILNQTKLSCVICDSVERVKKLLQSNSKSELKPVDKILVIHARLEELKEMQALPEAEHVQFYLFEDIERKGTAEIPVAKRSPGPDDLYMICYTSGTTGT